MVGNEDNVSEIYDDDAQYAAPGGPMTTRDETIAALKESAAKPVDFNDGTWERSDQPLAAKTVFSVRLPMEIAAEMLTEAERIGKKPSSLAAELVAEALNARKAIAGTVEVNVADLHRAIDSVIHRAA